MKLLGRTELATTPSTSTRSAPSPLWN